MRVVVRVRWRKRKGRSRVFLGLLTVGAIAALALSMWALRGGKVKPSSQATSRVDALTDSPVPQADLVLSEASIQGPAESRRVVGLVRNKSDRPYSNVGLVFTLSRDGNTAGVAEAIVSRIGGHDAARFETNAFAHARVQAILKEITADRR